MDADRRRSPRILIDPPLRARVRGRATEVTIAEVSFGGFRVESPVGFEHNTQYEFLVLPPVGHEVVQLDAIAVHCRRLSNGSGPLFETGFAFADPTRSALLIQALLDSVMAVLDTKG
jgi:hypothetical protein